MKSKRHYKPRKRHSQLKLTSRALAILLSGWKATTCLKKLKAASPVGVCGKYVTGVGRGHDMMDVRKIPIKIAPRTRYIIRIKVNILLALSFRSELGGYAKAGVPASEYSKPHSWAAQDAGFAVEC
jgi:hypothetical protein